MKQYLKNPIKTIDLLSLGLPLAILGLITALVSQVSCDSDPEATVGASLSGAPSSDNPRDLIMLLPMTEPVGHPLVVLKQEIPSLHIQLRYAKSSNVARQRLYDQSMPAMLDAPTAAKLALAQATLLRQGYSLKVWDAYRPPSAHLRLWRLSGESGYVADPRWGWSKHCSGRAIDVTLADAETGKEQRMPSKFDDFSSKAASDYKGASKRVANNVRTLRRAMLGAGFVGIDMEWWHFENQHLAQLNLPPVYADEAGVTVP